jgi:predicted transposase YbfD/YdcC
LRTIARQVRHNLPSSRWKDVPDPRRARGRRHRLSDLLQALVLGLVVGARTLRDVEALLRDLGQRQALGIRGQPSDTTLDRAARTVAPSGLRPLVVAQVLEMHRSKQLVPDPELGISLVAIDGKTLATDPVQTHPEGQAQGPDGTGPFVLRALRAMHTSSAVQPILGQRIIPAATNETATFRPFVEDLIADYGRTDLLACFTVDAAFTSAADLRWLHEGGYGFIASLKGNQPTLLDGAHRFLGEGEEPPPSGWERVEETIDPGRKVTRFFARTADLDRWHPEWPFLRQVWRIRQKTEHAGKVLWEDRYFLTNLPWNRLTPSRAIRAVVLHWSIENGANWTMDVLWEEDRRAWARTDLALETLAILRILAFNLIRLLRHRTLRASARDPLPYRRLFELVRMALTLPESLLRDVFS